MDAIRKAVADLRFSGIPKAILEKAFISPYLSWRQPTQINLEEQIIKLVIRPKVLVDCDILGGEQTAIPLEGLAFDKPNPRTTVIRIPKSRTNNRSIVSVLNISFLSYSLMSGYGQHAAYGTGVAFANNENTALMASTGAMMAAMDNIPVTSTADCKLIGENTISVIDVVSFTQSAYLRCMLANDENLNNIQIRSYLQFAKLVEFATKAFIYNELVIDVDRGELTGGMELGTFKSILDSYADAHQNYQDYLKEKWQAIALMNDSSAYQRYAKLIIGGHR